MTGWAKVVIDSGSVWRSHRGFFRAGVGGCRVAVAADTDDGRGFAGDRFLDRLADRGSLRSDLDRRFGDSPLQGAPQKDPVLAASCPGGWHFGHPQTKPEAVPKVS